MHFWFLFFFYVLVVFDVGLMILVHSRIKGLLFFEHAIDDPGQLGHDDPHDVVIRPALLFILDV